MTATGETPPPSPSPEAVRLHSEFLAEVNKRELSGSENFDKSVLTLSSAGLGLSVSFLKDFVPLDGAATPWILYASWGMFTAATSLTMASFMVSGKALNYQKGLAQRGYLEGDDAAFTERNPWAVWVPRLNLTSAVAFFSALSLTIAFIIINVEGKRMATDKRAPSSGSGEQRGATVPSMQRPVSAPVSAPTAPASAPSGSERGNGPQSTGKQ